jgi:hypothetical protein
VARVGCLLSLLGESDRADVRHNSQNLGKPDRPATTRLPVCCKCSRAKAGFASNLVLYTGKHAYASGACPTDIGVIMRRDAG